MTFALDALIRDASTVLGSDACRAGNHQWQSEGGRSCPEYLSNECSQAVYRCTTCGNYDYGQKGGPGATDCQNHCRERS